MGIKPVDRSTVTPTTKSLDTGASLLGRLSEQSIKTARPRSTTNRVLPNPMGVKKPPEAPGKVETKYGSYKPGSKGGAGSFPAEVTTTVDGMKFVVKGTPKANGTLKEVTSAQVSVPVWGAVNVGGGTEGRQSSIGTFGVKVPVGRKWSLNAQTSVFAPNDGTNKGVVTTGVSLTAPTGASEVKAEVKLVGAQEPGKSKTSYALGVSVPLKQKDQAIEVGIGYENNPTNPRSDVYSAKLGYKFGSDRIDFDLTTGANDTTAQFRFNIAKF